MGKHLDRVPFSGIIRIRDMMYSVENPFRLDQGDVSFDAPDTVKAAMRRAIDENQSHYLQTTGVPRLLELLADKLRRANGIPVGHSDEVMVTTGGIHALYLVCQALLEPGDEVILPDPTWPPCAGNVLAAQARPVGCPLHESLGLALRSRRARVEHHPGDARDLRQLAAQPHRRRPHPRRRRADRRDRPRAQPLADLRRGLRGRRLRRRRARQPRVAARHVRAHDLRLHLQQVVRDDRPAARISRRRPDATLRERIKKVLFYTCSNVTSIVQFGGIGALEGSQDSVAAVPRRAAGAARPLLRRHSRARRRAAHRRAAARRLLRVPAHRSGLARTSAARVAVVGDGRASDLARAHRLRARRRLRPARARATSGSASRAIGVS